MFIDKVPAMFCKIIGNADEKRIAAQAPTPGVESVIDIPYINDGTKEHLLDIYFPQGTMKKLPMVINIHGGGLMYGYKEINKYFNMYIASLGYTVFSINYNLVPNVTYKEQVRDVMAALCWIGENCEKYHGNSKRVMLTGDSAGGLLASYADMVNKSEKLRAVYGVKPSALSFDALGLISGMFFTDSNDLYGKFRPLFFGKDYESSEVYANMNWKKLLQSDFLTPCYLLTSEQDILHKQNLKFDKLLEEKNIKHFLRDCPKQSGHKLTHVFAVINPHWEESQRVIKEMLAFFEEQCKARAEEVLS